MRIFPAIFIAALLAMAAHIAPAVAQCEPGSCPGKAAAAKGKSSHAKAHGHRHAHHAKPTRVKKPKEEYLRY